MIIAVDPGPHTGIARWYFPDTREGEAIHVANFDFETLDLRDVEAPHAKLYDYLNDTVVWSDTLVLERFEFQKEKAQQRPHLNFTAAEYVGTVHTWHQIKPRDQRCTLITQSPSFAVGNDPFWDDKKLHYLGLLQRTRSEHERSALRHLLQYFSFGVGDKRFILALKGM
jgi:hypothetical protein